MITITDDLFEISFVNLNVKLQITMNKEEQYNLCDKLRNIVDGDITEFKNNSISVWIDSNKLIHIKTNECMCFVTSLKNFRKAIDERSVTFDIEKLRKKWNAMFGEGE